jgi:hypothetical protein
MTTITVDHAVLEQALEALEATHYDVGSAEKQRLQAMDTITALRAALAQQEPRNQCGETCERAKLCAVCAKGLAQEEQEPVAWQWLNSAYFRRKPPANAESGAWNPLYTAPPRREWQGLKEWEINDGRDQLPTEDLCNWSFRQGVYFAEAKLKEKNNG